MELKQIITATVAVILICLVAIPLIDDAQNNVYITENNTAQRYLLQEETGTDYRIDCSGNGIYTLNGAELNPPLDVSKDFFILSMTDTLVLQIITSSSIMQIIAYSPNIDDAASVTIKNAGEYIDYSNNTWTVHTTTKDYTGTYEWMFLTDDNGKYGFFRLNYETYIDNDATIYGFRESSRYNEGGVGNYAMTITHGSINSGMTGISWIYYNDVYSDVTDKNVIDIVLNGEKGEVSSSINKITETFEGSAPALVGSFIAPVEYHYLKSGGSTVLSLINIIPILLIAALLIGIGYSIMRHN